MGCRAGQSFGRERSDEQSIERVAEIYSNNNDKWVEMTFLTWFFLLFGNLFYINMSTLLIKRRRPVMWGNDSAIRRRPVDAWNR